ncbi:ATP-binding cassette domain-containing protein [Paraburkholderia phosphatilytica]|uniref:ABC transporter ATP-binding protein/permease n=1 Tax=Paraburkholderia phosphatilytica TaxID=2282883 RepID=UPI000E509CBE|nr:ATP-binding cassette domain-containing protein [Paraburkholderia phosphatilytica]
MKTLATRPLAWLAVLLAVYLCAPFAASIPQIGAADWASVDWHQTWSAVGVSAASASVASLFVLLGGVPLGYFLARSSSRKMALLGFVVQLPLALPPLTSGVLLLFLVGPYSPVGRVFGGMLTDTFAGIVLAEIFVSAPFLIIAARSAFAAVDPVYEDVAATLGHRAGSRFLRVMLPIAWPAIRAGLALSWLRAFGEFGATVMVAYHPYSLPVYTYVVFGSQGLPAMMPLLLPTLAIAVLCAALSIYSRNGRASLSALNLAASSTDDAAAVVPTPHPPLPDARLAFQFERTVGAFQLDVQWTPHARRLAIIGPSGSGKSMTLRLIAGLERDHSGHLRLGDTDLGALPPERRRIGYMPQDYGLFPHMTVAQQLAFPVAADATGARYWVEHLGLGALTQHLPSQLSFGQRQRVALARALTQHSQLLLFDEPFSALDTPRRRRLQASLRELQREIDAVTIIVTHDPDEAALLADEILVLEHGRVLQAGLATELFARPASVRVAELLGLPNVGAGIVLDDGRIDTEAGLVLHADTRAFATGARVMWQIAAAGVGVAANGAACGTACGNYAGSVEAIQLRRGDRYATVRIGGVSLDVRADRHTFDATAQRFEIAADAVSVWAASALTVEA